MYTKDDFLAAIKQSSLNYEQTALLYQAGDPRILQIQEAMATMLAMFSQQVEVAMQEPFLKSRDATVLADAAAKGLIFSAEPALVTLTVFNNADETQKLNAGRNVLDAAGRFYKIESTINVPPKQSVELLARQIQVFTQTETVAESEPFLAIEVTPQEEAGAVAYLSVSVNGETFMPSYKFNGVAAGDKVYHVDSDEYRRLLVRFGETAVVGYQPDVDDVITIDKYYSFGNVSLAAGSPFSLEYLQNNLESDLKIAFLRIEKQGVDPTNIATLRELVRYPSVYDRNAVFLGEFDLLLRAKFPDCNFLNVWNEQVEETARGANVANVNTLFISFSLPENATIAKEAVQQKMVEAINAADNSYKVKFVEPAIGKIQCTITASVSRLYDTNLVAQEIKRVLIQRYGRESNASKSGQLVVKHKDIHTLLKAQVEAISDQRGDFNVLLNAGTSKLPELFSFMDEGSIQVNLSYDDYVNDRWGA